MARELIHTSVPQGVNPGSSGYCVAVTTDGISRRLEQRLSELSNYKYVVAPGQGDESQNPVNFCHLVIRDGARQSHVLGRVQSNGLEDWGSRRSNYLAHWLILDNSECRQTGPAAMAFANLPGKWNGTVQRRSDGTPATAGSGRPGVCRTWKSVMGHAGWGGILAEADTQTTYIVYRPGQPIMSLIQESLLIVPESRRWQVTFSTYFSGWQLTTDTRCCWRGVLADSPEARAAIRAGQPIIDITEPAPLPTQNAYTAAAESGSSLSAQPSALPASPSQKPSSQQSIDSGDVYAVAGSTQAVNAEIDSDYDYSTSTPAPRKAKGPRSLERDNNLPPPPVPQRSKTLVQSVRDLHWGYLVIGAAFTMTLIGVGARGILSTVGSGTPGNHDSRQHEIGLAMTGSGKSKSPEELVAGLQIRIQKQEILSIQKLQGHVDFQLLKDMTAKDRLRRSVIAAQNHSFDDMKTAITELERTPTPNGVTQFQEQMQRHEKNGFPTSRLKLFRVSLQGLSGNLELAAVELHKQETLASLTQRLGALNRRRDVRIALMELTDLEQQIASIGEAAAREKLLNMAGETRLSLKRLQRQYAFEQLSKQLRPQKRPVDVPWNEVQQFEGYDGYSRLVKLWEEPLKEEPEFGQMNILSRDTNSVTVAGLKNTSHARFIPSAAVVNFPIDSFPLANGWQVGHRSATADAGGVSAEDVRHYGDFIRNGDSITWNANPNCLPEVIGKMAMHVIELRGRSDGRKTATRSPFRPRETTFLIRLVPELDAQIAVKSGGRLTLEVVDEQYRQLAIQYVWSDKLDKLWTLEVSPKVADEVLSEMKAFAAACKPLLPYLAGDASRRENLLNTLRGLSKSRARPKEDENSAGEHDANLEDFLDAFVEHVGDEWQTRRSDKHLGEFGPFQISLTDDDDDQFATVKTTGKSKSQANARLQTLLRSMLVLHQKIRTKRKQQPEQQSPQNDVKQMLQKFDELTGQLETLRELTWLNQIENALKDNDRKKLVTLNLEISGKIGRHDYVFLKTKSAGQDKGAEE